MKEKYKSYLDNDHSFDRTMLIGIFALVVVIAGCFGWLYEFIFYFFNGGMKEFYYRGGNFLPWINIYAIGSVMIYILTYKYRKNPLKVFLISVISTGLLEYFSGLGIYIIGDGLRYWDYNTEILNFGNINGFICLRSVMFFALSALLLMYVIVPFCFHVASKSNKKVFLIVTITICSIFLADEFYNLILTKLFNLPNAIKIYKSIGIHYM